MKAPPSHRQELALPRGRRARRIESRYINTGYYPGYDVLDQQGHWDQPTWEAIRQRMEEIPPLRFFTRDEAEIYRRLCDEIVGQDAERDPWTVPIVHFLDAKLHRNETDGYRFAGMPPMREAFRLGAAAVALDATMVVAGPSGQRTVAAADFFTDMFTTALGPDEILVEVRLPRMPGWTAWYEEFHRTTAGSISTTVTAAAPSASASAILAGLALACDSCSSGTPSSGPARRPRRRSRYVICSPTRAGWRGTGSRTLGRATMR